MRLLSTHGKIISICEEIKTLLLEKNEKYGDSALNPTRLFSSASTGEQLRVRIDDKLSRVAYGCQGDEDVVKDLVGYLLLLMIHDRSKSSADAATVAVTSRYKQKSPRYSINNSENLYVLGLGKSDTVPYVWRSVSVLDFIDTIYAEAAMHGETVGSYDCVSDDARYLASIEWLEQTTTYAFVLTKQEALAAIADDEFWSGLECYTTARDLLSDAVNPSR